jgi:hypothetical protein
LARERERESEKAKTNGNLLKTIIGKEGEVREMRAVIFDYDKLMNMIGK